MMGIPTGTLERLASRCPFSLWTFGRPRVQCESQKCGTLEDFAFSDLLPRVLWSNEFFDRVADENQ